MTKSKENINDHARFGATPVGLLVELEDIEERSISIFRAFNSHEHDRFDLISYLLISLGSTRGKEFITCLKEISEILQEHGRRRFEFRRVNCRCIGSDEALLAEIIRTSSLDQIDDVITMSSLFLKPNLIISFTKLTEQFSLDLKNLIKRSTKNDYIFENVNSKLH